MKKEIKQLVSLAKKYVEFAKSININEGFTDYKISDLSTLRIYMSDNHKTYSIYFDKVEIILFTETIHMPFDISIQELKNTIELFTHYLHADLKVKQKEIIEEQKKMKKNEIELLELKINKLRNEID